VLQPMSDLPERVIGFQADGKLTADDYKRILIPAVEKQLASGDDVRIVLVFASKGSPPTLPGRT
jgi:hypothetical protein